MFNKSNIYNDIYSSTNIISGDEYKETISAISQLASDMVVKTLGPYGSTTIIDDGAGFTYPTKDGWTYLNKLKFNDPIYNTIFSLLKQISFNSVNTVGDGTTSAMVGANYFLQIINTVKTDPGFRQADFVDIVQLAAKNIEDYMLTKGNVKKISSDNNYEDIYKIAYVATNGNEAISRMISNIYTETGNPNINISLVREAETSYVIENGYKLDCVPLNFKYYVNNEDGTYTKKTPTRCVIFDHNITFNEHKNIISGISSLASRNNEEVIIFAPYFDDIIASVINTSIQKMMNQGQIPNIVLAQVPLTLDSQRMALSDIALLTNTQIFDTGKVRAFNILFHNQTHDESEKIEDDIFEIESYNFSSPQDILEICMGMINTLIMEEKHAFIQDYESIMNKNQYDIIIKEASEKYTLLKEKANKSLNGHLDKDYMDAHMRYIKLLGKTGSIRVGGLSDLQRRCDKDSIDDAVLVCRSAFENGYIRGMNLEILSVINNIISEYDKDDELKSAYIMLYDTFFNLSMSVMRNKYLDSESLREVTLPDGTIKVHTNVDVIKYCIEHNTGYNLITETIEDDNFTVINSVSTDLEILKAIVNILSTIMTSNQFVSLMKNYDRQLTHDQALERQIRDKEETTSRLVDAIISRIKKDKLCSEFMNAIIKLSKK